MSTSPGGPQPLPYRPPELLAQHRAPAPSLRGRPRCFHNLAPPGVSRENRVSRASSQGPQGLRSGSRCPRRVPLRVAALSPTDPAGPSHLSVANDNGAEIITLKQLATLLHASPRTVCAVLLVNKPQSGWVVESTRDAYGACVPAVIAPTRGELLLRDFPVRRCIRVLADVTSSMPLPAARTARPVLAGLCNRHRVGDPVRRDGRKGVRPPRPIGAGWSGPANSGHPLGRSTPLPVRAVVVDRRSATNRSGRELLPPEPDGCAAESVGDPPAVDHEFDSVGIEGDVFQRREALR